MNIRKWFVDTTIHIRTHLTPHRGVLLRREVFLLGFVVVLLLGTADLIHPKAQTAKANAASGQTRVLSPSRQLAASSADNGEAKSVQANSQSDLTTYGYQDDHRNSRKARKRSKCPSCVIDYVPAGLISKDRILFKPEPTYPTTARAKRISGSVFVFVLIDIDGKVLDARISSGPPPLQQSALSAAQQARFSPTKLSGQPVRLGGLLKYDFPPQQLEWQTIDVGILSFIAPKDLRGGPRQGVDSSIWRYQSSTLQLDIDAGLYAGYPTFEKKLPGYREKRLTIDGAAALIWFYKDQKPGLAWVSGAHFEFEGLNESITMDLISDDPNLEMIAEKIFTSMKFNFDRSLRNKP